MNHIEGKTVVITGGASGFGRLIAQRVTGLGGNVVVGDVNDAGLSETVELAGDGTGAITAVAADVTDLAQMHALAGAAADAYGSIDVMVNNAGIMPLAMFADHEAASEAWSRCVDINIKGVLHGIVAVHDQMIEQGHGHVINISSIYGNYPVAGAAVYGATKAAVNVISESLRQETQGRIKVTNVRPTGVPATNLVSEIVNPEAAIGILGHNMGSYMEQMGRLATEAPPENLASPESIGYLALAPELMADQIVYAMNQPLGVSISDITVRATGDQYII